ncbi:MAG TPA: long-chain-acyl-CoA synthetase [Gammaproteobacteria bacterium]|nr:long-chain-acyl-CoA synthetase [Gammaproteobacteria bacterium]|tara:strand:- start:1133 stop:3004 length:1872 start_codon:yes stop_codon:yes gene_type:complete
MVKTGALSEGQFLRGETMALLKDIETLTQIPALLRLKKGMVPRPMSVKDCPGARVEETAARFGDSSAILFEGRTLSWGEFNALANRYAHCLKAQGLQRGDSVSIVMENRVEFLALLIGLNKLGVAAGLLNTNLTGRSLAHCMSVIDSKKCIFGSEVTHAIEGVREELATSLGLRGPSDLFFVGDKGDDQAPEWAQDLDVLASNMSDDNPSDTGDNTLGEIAFYIHTSGTTGLPKAAVMSNRRYLQSASLAGVAGLKCKPSDRIYLCLPLYHGTGLLIGVGSSITTGASMFIRRKFSASNFLREVRDHGCTHMVYIGELCRYLTNIPEQADDARNPLRSIMGNGMRPDIWMTFKKRYGISRICEFYGASEGNVAFANLMNKDCTVGMTTSEVVLVEYDVDQDQVVRDSAGRCIPVAPGEPGLLLCKITPNTRFEGYTDAAATQNKVLENALEEGDAWFNTGDLMRTVEVGFTLNYDHYQFVDRVGDTFRWKSENVSTNEVGEILNNFHQIKFSNVYGVQIPHTDGRAGMVSITLDPDHPILDLAAFSQFVRENLPSYAIPVFIRIDADIEVTGTFKMLKGDLKKQGYDIGQVEGPVYVMRPGEERYVELDDEYLSRLTLGTAGF